MSSNPNPNPNPNPDPDPDLDPNPNQGGRQVPLTRLPAPLHAPQAEPPAERGHGALRTSDCRPLDRLLTSEAGPRDGEPRAALSHVKSRVGGALTFNLRYTYGTQIR